MPPVIRKPPREKTVPRSTANCEEVNVTASNIPAVDAIIPTPIPSIVPVRANARTFPQLRRVK